MGGHIAGSFALQFPSLVEKLVLVNSAGIGDAVALADVGEAHGENASVTQNGTGNGESPNHETQLGKDCS